MSKSSAIGIYTVDTDFFLMNYGSFFQHFALREALRKLGFQPRRIKRRGYWRSLALYILTPFGVWKDRRLWRFWQRGKFVRDYRKLIGPVFERSFNKQPSAYIVGSDAIWMYNSAPAFLAEDRFAALKISYAASTAWDRSSQQDWWCERMKDVGETFRAVSVREEVGRELCQDLMPKQKVECVVDPTLLLTRSDYKRVTSERRIFNKPTLLYYAVNIWNEEDLQLPLLEESAKCLGCELKIIGIQGAENFVPNRYAFDPSPREFLRAVRDANYFVTNSFHGLAFSIIFCKQFVFLTQLAKVYGNQNCRQDGILNKMGLIDRKVSSQDASADKIVEVLNRPVDIDTLEQRHETERTRCINWLKEALS